MRDGVARKFQFKPVRTTMRGIIMAGGMGTRVFPVTKTINKHLVPIYSKPMIYYPLTTLMLGGIQEILLISTPEALPSFRQLLGDGSQFGISITYAPQARANGIAEAFKVAGEHMDPSPVTLILGDNLFFGAHLQSILVDAFQIERGGRIFAQKVEDPKRFGVVSLDENLKPVAVIEKPSVPASSYAATGLYVYDESVFEIASNMAPSARGEYEITDVNQHYIEKGELDCVLLPRGTVWIDAGTIDSLFEASSFVRVVEKRTRMLIGAPEEVALEKGYISKSDLENLLKGQTSEYYQTLRSVLDSKSD